MMKWMKKLDRKEAEKQYKIWQHCVKNKLQIEGNPYIYWFNKDGRQQTICVHCHTEMTDNRYRRICKDCLKLDIMDRFKIKAKPMFIFS